MSQDNTSSKAEMAQAFQELARGEQQAAAMEANLAKLEEKLDSMLAQFEGKEAASDVPTKKPVASEKGEQDEKKV